MPRKNVLSLHEAIVVALINQPSRTATFEQIAKFIKERNLYPKRKGNIPLATHIMLRATKAKGFYHDLFEEIGAGYVRLRDTINPIKFYSDLEGLLEYDKQFYTPDAKSLNVIDRSFGSKETLKLKISPANVICIHSKDKTRVKNIYLASKNITGAEIVTRYEFNNNKYNFKTLCQYLDPASNYLLLASKSAIVNVAFFEMGKRNELIAAHKGLKNYLPSLIPVSGKGNGSESVRNFKIIQESYKRRILLQKTAIGYRNDLSLEGQP